MAKTDITGQRFGRLVATSPDRLVDSGWLWHCKCDCGTLCSVKMSLLRNGNTKSCGCLKRELIRAKNYRHGLLRRGAASPEYYAFRNAMQRCIDPNDARFADYGGRGIEFRFNSFKKSSTQRQERAFRFSIATANGALIGSAESYAPRVRARPALFSTQDSANF